MIECFCMKPVLLYDGYCNFCIKVIQILEFLNYFSFTGNKVVMVPLQSPGNYVKKYGLTRKELHSKIHLISEKGEIYKGNKAIRQLARYFPVIYPVALLFGTSAGRVIYDFIANNRHKFLGCGDNCYVSRHSKA